MKKIILIFLFFLLIASHGVSQAQELFDFPQTEQGQYIYYRDSRSNNPRLTGLLKFYDNTIICRTINLKTNETCIVVLKIALKGQDIEVTPVEVVAGDLKLNLQYVIVDIANIASQYFCNAKDIDLEKKIFKDEWPEFGYTLEHTFTRNVPFFNLLSTRNVNSNKTWYEAVIMGKMSDPKDPVFLKINSFTVAANNVATFKIPVSSKRNVKLYNFTISLDENWVLVKGGSTPNLPHDSYWLSLKSKRDAQIGIESFNLNELDRRFWKMSASELARIFIGINWKVLPSSINIDVKTENDATAEFLVLDKENNFQTFMLSRTIKKGNQVYVVNFSTYRETYETNEKYFESIIQSIVFD